MGAPGSLARPISAPAWAQEAAEVVQPSASAPDAPMIRAVEGLGATAPTLPRPLAAVSQAAPEPRLLPNAPLGASALLQRALNNPSAREPLPLTARAQLAPLLGRDVSDVQLIRDPLAAAATAAANADALAVGNAVLLSPGQDLTSPRGLGLLAHELTHVLREREPGFVPAVVRTPRAPLGTERRRLAPPPRAAAPETSVAPQDEERLAEQVEGRVRREVREAQASTGVPQVSQASRIGTLWENLPAPWEPMPYWDDQPSPTTGAAGRPARTEASPPPAAPAPVAPTAPVARAAETGRSVGGGNSGNSDASSKNDVGADRRKAQHVPDLEQLAQQVYGLLKRRLSTEMRRGR